MKSFSLMDRIVFVFQRKVLTERPPWWTYIVPTFAKTERGYDININENTLWIGGVLIGFVLIVWLVP